jgi:hypothetical protein
MDIAAVADVARRQHGLVTRAQVLAVASDHQLKRSLRNRSLEPVRRGVYRLAGVPETWPQHVLAVCLTAGAEAHASFRTGAALHGLPGFSRDVIEITHLGSRPSAIDGVQCHETTVFAPGHVTNVDRIP